jgi:ADP-heptose:LPS heptosyltransferase
MTAALEKLDLSTVNKVAFVNFGGIGDEILFSPVLSELRQYAPRAHTTLFLEERSMAVAPLLPGVDCVEPISLKGLSRVQLFFELTRRLRRKYFDVVIASGSSPFIPLMLWASGIRYRVGFQTGWSSQKFLSVEGPLDRQAYAGEMYFSLARSFLSAVLGAGYTPPVQIVPVLQPPSEEDRAWAKALMGEQGPKILMHPGVSQVSIDKNILKGWAPTQWGALIHQLGTMGHHVYLAGGPDDGATIEAILDSLPEGTPYFHNLYGETRHLMHLAALIEAADVLVSVDSSPLHIAVGLGKPVVTMFGPTDPKKLVPTDERFRVVARTDLNCRPCLWDLRQTSCDTPTCLEVSMEAILQEVQGALKASV